MKSNYFSYWESDRLLWLVSIHYNVVSGKEDHSKVKKAETKKDPIYSRPAGKVKKIYPLEIKDKVDSKTIALILNPAEASKLAVALINAVQMVTSKSKDIYVTVWLDKGNYTVTVKGSSD